MKLSTLYLAVPLAYLLLVGLFPHLLGELSPCWLDSMASVSFDICNVGLMLQYYSWLSLMSMGVVLLVIYVLSDRFALIRFVTLGILLALIAMCGFWLYIPVLERDIASVPRYVSEHTF